MKKTEVYNEIKKLVVDYPEYVEFLDKEIAKADEKAKKNRDKRAEKTAEVGAAIREGVVKALENAGRPITMAELVAGVGVEGVTAAKVAYYIKPLVEDMKVIKKPAKIDGRKIMTYALA